MASAPPPRRESGIFSDAEDGTERGIEDYFTALGKRTVNVFVPGRVCLFGEHSDWAGAFRRFNRGIERGYTLVVGTNQGLFARVTRHPTHLVAASTGSAEGLRVPMQPKALLAEAQKGGFWSYTCGVAYKILTDYRVSGMVLHNYDTTLPLKKGLSSSAAVCVLTARAFNRLYNLKMTTRGEMEYAYQGEILTPSQCGRMDQACAFGDRPVLLTYDGEFVDARHDSAEDFCRLKARRCTAMDRIFIPAYCFAIS